jgi:hypothetical protein
VNTCLGKGVPVLQGDFGTFAPPRIISFVVDDPDDLDEVYSAGDTLTLSLDMATDALSVHEPSGDRSYVDSIFTFSLSVGADYSGNWQDSSTFVVTVTDATGAGQPALSGPCVDYCAHTTNAYCHNISKLGAEPCDFYMRTNTTHPAREWPKLALAFFSDTSGLRSSSGRNPPSGGPPALHGSFGTLIQPIVLAAVVDDPDHADPAWSPGDTITLHFDKVTNFGGGMPGVMPALPMPLLAAPAHRHGLP